MQALNSKELLSDDLLGKLFLIVGPSGSGKGTVINAFKKHYPGFVFPVSYTTRNPRKGEEDGDVYHFITRDEFEKMIENDEFLEYATVHFTDYYGTSKKDIIEPLKSGAFVMREVDIQGFNSIRKLIPKENLVSVFMEVSDEEDLRNRILLRGKISEEELERRMESVKKEVAQADQCDYRVQNEWGKIKECVVSVEKILLKETEDFIF